MLCSLALASESILSACLFSPGVSFLRVWFCYNFLSCFLLGSVSKTFLLPIAGGFLAGFISLLTLESLIIYMFPQCVFSWSQAIPFFFLCLASSDRPRFSRFQKKKKSYTEGNQGNQGNQGNDTLFQTIVTLIWNISIFLPYRFLVFSCSRLILTTTSTFSFLHYRDVDFVTTPCCFQAPRILCWGTRPPSSRLLFQYFFFSFSDRPTQNQKTHSAINEKKGRWPYYFVTLRVWVGLRSQGDFNTFYSPQCN